ncbi:PEP-CTERM sorting domain-containing protein [Aquabacterium sp. NJ1]|uniref:PEP-CTERM sorting domain-containing protein n=1 Tax=Aquabacterium sp. NJ1 TaxID=1538295 RepID=UPI001377C8A9|nr:PEP-CTERM sorting domain-containing protein [Aquabacterium sp. NJ1]
MPDHITRKRNKTPWKWAAGAAWALMASAAMADAPALQVLTPNGNWNWDGVLGMQDGGTSTLSLSSELWSIKATPYGTASNPVGTPGGSTAINTPVITQNTYSVVSAPDNAIYEIGSTGGVTLTASYASGSLTITDLSVNFGTRLISATLIGGNGLGQIQNVPLWNVDNISSTVLGCPDNGGMCDAGGLSAAQQPQHRLDTVLTGLHLTAEGNSAFKQAMGWQQDIASSFDFGTLSTSTMFLSGPALHAVPEPGTWALMGLGLVGLFGATRRRA